MKYPKEKLSNSQNTHKKKSRIRKMPTRKNFCNYEILRRKNFKPTEELQTHKKAKGEKFCSYKIPTRKNFKPTKYAHEKKLGPQNTL